MADTGAPSNTIDTATYTTGAQIKAADHTVPHADIKTKYAEHTHDLTANCVSDAELAELRVQSIHASDKYVLVSGAASVTIAGGFNLSPSKTVTFADDATQGDPGFSETPHVAISVVRTGGPQGWGYNATILSLGTTSFIVEAHQLDGGTSGGSLSIHWIAYGKVA